MNGLGRVRLCRGCSTLLAIDEHCSCERRTVWVITDLGPTDGPGLVVRAELSAVTR